MQEDNRCIHVTHCEECQNWIPDSNGGDCILLQRFTVSEDLCGWAVKKAEKDTNG